MENRSRYPISSQTLKEVQELLPFLNQQEREELDKLLTVQTGWIPLPGPQTQALNSEADILFYGGAAGGGKTDLLLGAACTLHWRSVIFRRVFPSLRAIVDRSKEIFSNLGTKGDWSGRYNESTHRWKMYNGRMLEFGAMQYDIDSRNYQGRPHDLYGFDEVTEFLESQFRFVIGWNRTVRDGVRCRVIATGNPPTTAEGDWVIQYWAPWLDKHHPNPAKPGELRWYTTIEGVDRECVNGNPFKFQGEVIRPKSRSFIPARIEDNPYLIATGYKGILQSLPEPLRSKMLKGDFGISQDDNPFQVIPTKWVELAQQRWKERERPEGPMTSVGTDCARGGRDKMILSPRYGTYFDEQIVIPGVDVPDGPTSVAYMVKHKVGNPVFNLDVIGIGSSVYDVGKLQGLNIIPINGAEGSEAKDKSGQLGFVNQRAEHYWKMREALDPDTGEDLALPPDRELLADLCTPRWSLKRSGIQIESKDEIIKRIGRSPDKGDAAVYANAIKVIPGAGIFEYYRLLASQAQQKTDSH